MVRIGISAKGNGLKQSANRREKGVCIAAAVESIVRCKWSLQVLGRIRRGITRPGALVRACPGLSTKVLNERLAKMVRFGILERIAFPEVPPRVEYRLTDMGVSFVKILDAIENLQHLANTSGATDPSTAAKLTNSRSATAKRTVIRKYTP
ncbi:MAG: hypothetical protein HBSAPP02_18240 [Phycisphaerae bacterium]|nr:MAG: helix-turn-helix transcriptional regulator [Planctomycetia bacterium]RIK69609.1 MAG: transcriptional regulator [Planctomycetota bacterium]GJQ26792.1 MAG: hypothetical protein HBSAPP02_18240 [Phycisphaerae bacterium]